MFFLLGLLVAVEGDLYANGYKGPLFAQNTYKKGQQNNGKSNTNTSQCTFGFVFHLVDLPLPKTCFRAVYQHYQRLINTAKRQNQREAFIIQPLLAHIKLSQNTYNSPADTPTLLI